MKMAAMFKKAWSASKQAAFAVTIAIFAALITFTFMVLSADSTPMKTVVFSTLAVMSAPFFASLSSYAVVWKGYSRLRFSWMREKINEHPQLKRNIVEIAQWNGLVVLSLGLLVAFSFTINKDWTPVGAHTGYYASLFVAYFLASSTIKKAHSDYYIYGTLNDEARREELSWKDRLVGGKSNNEVTTWAKKFSKNSVALMMPNALGYKKDGMPWHRLLTVVGFLIVTFLASLAFNISNGNIIALMCTAEFFTILYWWLVAFVSRIINDERAVAKIRLSPRR